MYAHFHHQHFVRRLLRYWGHHQTAQYSSLSTSRLQFGRVYHSYQTHDVDFPQLEQDVQGIQTLRDDSLCLQAPHPSLPTLDHRTLVQNRSPHDNHHHESTKQRVVFCLPDLGLLSIRSDIDSPR